MLLYYHRNAQDSAYPEKRVQKTDELSSIYACFMLKLMLPVMMKDRLLAPPPWQKEYKDCPFFVRLVDGATQTVAEIPIWARNYPAKNPAEFQPNCASRVNLW